jgi:hypothetical protein
MWFWLLMCWIWTIGAVLWLMTWANTGQRHALVVCVIYELVALLYGFAAVASA